MRTGLRQTKNSFSEVTAEDGKGVRAEGQLRRTPGQPPGAGWGGGAGTFPGAGTAPLDGSGGHRMTCPSGLIASHP